MARNEREERIVNRFQKGVESHLTPRTSLFVPQKQTIVCIASPLLCYALNLLVAKTTGYQFGYELLMLNGLFTFLGLWVTDRKKKLSE